MNKFLLLGAAAAALICAGAPAFAADTATTSVTISGTSPNTCTLTAASATGTSGGVAQSSAGAPVSVTSLFSITDSHNGGGGIVLHWTGMCNYAHSVGLSSANGALINGAPPTIVGGTFTQRVGYTANFAWAGSSATTGIPDSTSTSDPTTLGTTKTSATAILGANAGDLAVTLAFPASSNPTAAGAYSDTLTVQIGNQI